MNVLKTMIADQNGATMVEYGLMIALIAAVCFIAVSAVGSKLSAIFTTLAGDL